jgi:hypothetical protein
MGRYKVYIPGVGMGRATEETKQQLRRVKSMNNKELNIYHGQADKDIFATVPDLSDRIIRTTMKEIKEAYNEFMEDLLMEAQEAY